MEQYYWWSGRFFSFLGLISYPKKKKKWVAVLICFGFVLVDVMALSLLLLLDQPEWDLRTHPLLVRPSFSFLTF